MNGSRTCDLIKYLSTTILFKTNTLLARLNRPSVNKLNTICTVSNFLKNKKIYSCYCWNSENQNILARSNYKPNNCLFRHYTNDSSNSSKNKNAKSSLESNKLTVKESQRLMRLIYARVHPDLFTNHLEAKKLNEDSLKTLRNLNDFYVNSQLTKDLNQSLSGFKNVKSKYIEFYLKSNSHKDEVQLKKIQISLTVQSFSSIEDLLENIFNQFIEKLNLSLKKFNRNPNEKKLPSFLRSHGNNKYRVTYKNVKVNFNHEDDEFISDEQFEQWYEEYSKKNKTPSLRKWIRDNSQQISERNYEAQKLKDQLQKNKDIVINKWKLKDIIIKSNWSLQTSNSYVAQMVNYTSYFSDFSGQTLVLTSRISPGLQKNGHIYLNCDQVYEEWLFILGFAKQEQPLLKEIAEMESNLSMLLNGIQICDNLDKNKTLLLISFDERIDTARYYSKTLHNILNRFTEEIKTEHTDLSEVFYKNDFSNLQLSIQKTDEIELNSIGQFVIGNHRRITYKDIINFVKENRNQSIKLYKSHVELMEEERNFLAKIKKKLILKNLLFDSGVNYEQRIKTMKQLINMVEANSSDSFETIEMLNNTELVICNSTSYSLNDDGSINVPWNWFEYDKNNN